MHFEDHALATNEVVDHDSAVCDPQESLCCTRDPQPDVRAP